jgi:hypothetical protein
MSIEDEIKYLEAIETLTLTAAQKGYLEEKDFDAQGIPQTEEEAKAQELHSRDDLPLWRRRMVIYSSEGSRQQRKSQREDQERKKAAEIARKEKEKKRQN